MLDLIESPGLQVDKDGSGDIDFSEFVEFVCEEGPVVRKTKEGNAPRSFDASASLQVAERKQGMSGPTTGASLPHSEARPHIPDRPTRMAGD